MEDFFDLLSFTGRPSLALTELFMNPLRFILSDTAICNKLNESAPLDLGYLCNPIKRAARKKDDLRDFDCEFNGFRLLQKKIKPDAVDMWKFQAVLRMVLPRLQNTMQMQEAVGDIFLLLRHHLEQERVCHKPELRLLLLRVEYLHLWGHEKRDAIKEKKAKALEISSSLQPSLGQEQGQSCAVDYSSLSGSQNEIPIPYMRCVEVKDLFKDNESLGGSGGGRAGASAAAEDNQEEAQKDEDDSDEEDNEEVLLDADAIFQYTADCIVPFEELISAIEALESVELHQLSARHKLSLLKLLFEACYETRTICDLLESNAEELAVKIAEFNAQKRIAALKNFETHKAKREKAVAACKKANEAERKKNGIKGKSLAPSADQVAAMVEELVFLESIGVDEVVEDMEVEPVSEDEDEEDGDKADDESNSVPRATRSNLASRSDWFSRKKQRAKRRAKNLLIEAANEKLDLALARKNEKIIRQALRAAEKAGMKGTTNGSVFCTQRMRAVSPA